MKTHYKVTATPRKDLRPRFLDYMSKNHIPDMEKTGYFLSAQMTETERGVFEIVYVTKDRKTLDAYFENDAEVLRNDFIRHFPEGITITREIV
ncbi:MAG: DUF4286 family protein [Pyrinomonadaceae bacterium]|nr:DUF4286 family protein [Pyrinomonadaceae bacterium]